MYDYHAKGFHLYNHMTYIFCMGATVQTECSIWYDMAHY